MGAFGGLIQTNKGRNLQAKAEAGAQLKFTRMGVGDGQLGGQSIPSLNKLIHETMSLPITRLKPQLPAQAIVGAVLSSQDVTTGFFFRELGIFAQDPDEGEILYAYGNSGSAAEYIPPVGSPDIIEKTIDMIVTFGQAQNVSAVINSSLIFATPDDVETALEEAKQYTDTAVAGVKVPDASLTQKGITQLSSAIDSTSEAMAATPKAVKSAYDRGSAGVTAAAAAQAKADAAETPAGAQAKANAAEANAKNYVDGKTWQKQRLTTDSGASLILAAGTNLNNIRTTGFYDGTGLINAPGNGWYYIEVQSHSSNPGAWTIQKAHDFNNNTYYQRTCTNGTWSAWQELFQSVANGKQAIATAISGKGIAASGSDEFAVLAQKIGQIETGLKILSGTLPTYQDRSITNLPFAPKALFMYLSVDTTVNDRAYAYGYAGAWLTPTNTVQYSRYLEVNINNSSYRSSNLSDVEFGSNYVNFLISGGASALYYVVIGV